jgi:hypothetical protein
MANNTPYTDKKFWQKVYLASINAGKESWHAKQAADDAVRNQP